MLNITVQDFSTLLDGIAARRVADNVATPQCFDVAQLWARVIGSAPFTGATADLIYNQPGDLYTQVANTPNDFPVAGDLIIWNWPHVALVISADVNQVTVLEQNDPTGSECHTKSYNYNGVIGWLHPKQLPTDNQAIIDDLRTARDNNWNLYQAEVSNNTQLSQNVATLSGEVSDYKSKYESEQETNIKLNANLASLGDVLSQVKNEDKQYANESLAAQHERDSIKARFITTLGLLSLTPDVTDDQIKQRIAQLTAPSEQTVNELMPILEQLWDAAVYKRVPKVKSFFRQITDRLKALLHLK